MQKQHRYTLICLVFLLAVACRPIARPADSPRTPGAISTAVPAPAQNVTFANGSLVLAGTLILPPWPGPHPVVVTITGSGPQDRDNAAAELPEYRPYRQLAEALAQVGIATLRYDDRGVGKSSGDITTATPAELATDVEAALSYLTGTPDIDAGRIALLGHSEGASVAAMVAARNPKIVAVVALAGPALSGATLQEQTLKKLAPAMAAKEMAAFALTRRGDWTGLEEHLTQVILDQLHTLPEEGQDAIGDLEAAARAQAAIAVEQVYRNPRYLFTMTYDPAEDWRRVRTPVLALYAQHDDLVTAAQNKPALAAALADAGNQDFTIDLVTGVNHLFLPATATTTPDEWASLPQQLPADAVDIIVSWLDQKL
jgi:uncharacterized protein